VWTETIELHTSKLHMHATAMNHKPRDLDLDQQTLNKQTVSPAYQSLLVYRTKFFSVLVLSFPHCDDDPLSDFDIYILDGFNIDGNSENVEESC